MAIKDWELDQGGNLRLAPVVGWDSAVGGMYGLLRVRFVRGEDQLQRGEFEAVQVGMTAQQARQLADDLRQMAERIEATDWGSPQ